MVIIGIHTGGLGSFNNATKLTNEKIEWIQNGGKEKISEKDLPWFGYKLINEPIDWYSNQKVKEALEKYGKKEPFETLQDQNHIFLPI